MILFVLILAAAAIAVIAAAKGIASHPFKCRHCGKEFHIHWPKVIITEHIGSEYQLICPFCGTKDWCSEQ